MGIFPISYDPAAAYYAGLMLRRFLISKLQKRQLEREICSICCSEHNIKQLVTTNCGHTFGKCCFSNLLDYNYDNNIEIVCPCCRNDKIELIRYVI